MNSNPNTPVAGLVERLTDEAMRLQGRGIDRGCVDSSLAGNLALEVADFLEKQEAHIEQLEADKRAVEEVLDWAYDHEPQLIERMRYMIATISNPSPVKGTE